MSSNPPVVQTATVAAPAPATSMGSFLDGLDMRIVETGPAVLARKCSTDNGCDTKKTGDC